MPLYQITEEALVSIPPTTFAQERVRERTDLQRLLRSQIEVIAPDTLIVAEEFGDWERADGGSICSVWTKMPISL